MSNVFVDKHKLDVLATAISNKSGVPLTLTLTEMVDAVDNIQIVTYYTGSSTPSSSLGSNGDIYLKTA